MAARPATTPSRLQNRGFKTTIQRNPVQGAARFVINTDPSANTSVAAGDTITINISTGPEQREVPDEGSRAGRGEAEDAGFENVKQAQAVSAPAESPARTAANIRHHQRDHSRRSGSDTKAVPDVKGWSVEEAQTVLTASQFTAPLIPVQVDGLKGTQGQMWARCLRRMNRGRRHPDSGAGVAGQPIRDAGPARHVLGRCGAAAPVTGLAEFREQLRQVARCAEQRPADRRGGGSGPTGRHPDQVRRHRHAELRPVGCG